MKRGLKCPFDCGKCDFPSFFDPFCNFKISDFVGCEISTCFRGRKIVYWICPRFPVDMSITAVREAFEKLDRE